MGFERVHTVDPYDLKEVETALRECLEAEGPALVISQRECALLPEAKEEWTMLEVNEERCNGCGLCFQVGCPAIVKSDRLDPKSQRPLAWIDPLLCTGCEICAQVCARRAILFRDQMAQKEV
jgi:indolepyruvate ferredoxin oxidoreductase alpha subunit